MQPMLSVVVASHSRPLRLRWLLAALAEQTLDRTLWEVVVCHHAVDRETAQLLASHPLGRHGTLVAVADPRVSRGAKCNAALRVARAPTLVFTEDHCRPPSTWLTSVLEAARRHPSAIIQGPVEGDPDEWAIRRAAYPRTREFSRVPTPWAECSNIVYPRDLVLRTGGFAEHLRGGEDTELNARAREAGASYLGDARMLTYHAIIDESIFSWIRSSGRWGDLPWVFKHHPRLRRELLLGVFWRREHAWLLAGLWALAGIGRNPLRALAVVPWGVARGAHGRGSIRGHVRDIVELPGWIAVDLAELLVLVVGSARHHTVVL